MPKPAALNMFVYPGQNQDAAQQNKDEVECYGWARQQTNIDPMASPPPVQAAATKDTFKKAWGACLEGRGYNVK